MPQKTVIIGAGLIGCAIAAQLARRGAEVCLLEAGAVGGAASGASFGWINASFFADEVHFALRAEGIAAHHRLQDWLGSAALRWPGALWWEEQGAGFDRQRNQLLALGYAVEELNRQAFAALAPAIGAPPERALLLPQEGVAEAEILAQDLARAAMAEGARIMPGARALRILTRNGEVCGIETEAGQLAADQVVIAAGTGCPALLDPLEVALPMLSRPGLLLRTRPVAPVISQIMVAPGQEFRQDAAGRIIAPTVEAHQSDTSESFARAPEREAETALRRISSFLPGQALHLAQIGAAWRPVPGDGLPVLGAVGPEGLYLAVMHSGVTLAAIAAEIAADEITRGSSVHAGLVAGYRPQRFGRD